MARSEREDFPGAMHHVMNRGIARRPLFEDARDVRRFLAALAAAVRRREIRVLIYCIMTTHFHLVVESNGHLAQAMARVQRAAVACERRRRPRLFVQPPRAARDAWEMIEIALLRDLTAARWTEVARILRTSIGYVVARYHDHRTALTMDNGDSAEVAALSEMVLTQIQRVIGEQGSEDERRQRGPNPSSFPRV